MSENGKRELNFGKRTIAEIVPPVSTNGKKVEDIYHDEKVPGLILRVHPSGTKTFCVKKKLQGRVIKCALGNFPGMTPEVARQKAAAKIAEIAQGVDPNKEKRRFRAEMTFGEAFQSFLELHCKKHRVGWKENIRSYEMYLSHWKNRKLSAITRREIEALHAKYGVEHGHNQANHILALTCTMFNRIIDWGYEGANPARAIRKFKIPARGRYLLPEEREKFFEAFKNQPEHWRDLFMLLLLTGVRRGNIQSLRWEHIDFERGLITIPKTKNGDAQVSPLTAQAIAILERRRAAVGNSPFVFPSPKSASGHVKEPKKAWTKLLKDAEIEDLHLHDLRATIASWSGAQGVGDFILMKMLGHRDRRATAVYTRMSSTHLDPVRLALENATSSLLGEKEAVNG